MKNINLLFCFWLLFFCACNSEGNQNPKTSVRSDIEDSDVTKAKPDITPKTDSTKQITPVPELKDTLLTIRINNNKGSIRAYLGGIGRYVTLIIPISGGDSIIAEILPEDNAANIRFNQIYIPVGNSGKYDGPFSRHISYPISVKGNYKLIIGENQMAEGDWKGNFICNVLIK